MKMFASIEDKCLPLFIFVHVPCLRKEQNMAALLLIYFIGCLNKDDLFVDKISKQRKEQSHPEINSNVFLKWDSSYIISQHPEHVRATTFSRTHTSISCHISLLPC